MEQFINTVVVMATDPISACIIVGAVLLGLLQHRHGTLATTTGPSGHDPGDA